MPIHNFSRPRGRIVELTVSSPLLENAFDDPTERTIAVYLPPDYDNTTGDYPLLVDLAAYTSSGLKRLAWTGFGESVPQRLERLVAQGEMGPVIVAFPDGFTSLGGNQYVDTPAIGRWERFLVEVLVPTLEREFRVRPGRTHRAVYGKSSGGYGALIQGLRHAEHWQAVACHSGDMGFAWTVLREFPSVLDALARFDGDPSAFLRHVRAQPKVSGQQFHVLMMLGLALSYDPDPRDPAHIRLPVDPYTCELDEQAWSRWLAHDPVHIVEDRAAQSQLKRLHTLYIDCGHKDQFLLHYGARMLTRRLERFAVPHMYEEFDDTHSGIDYRLDRSLPLLYRAVTAG